MLIILLFTKKKFSLKSYIWAMKNSWLKKLKNINPFQHMSWAKQNKKYIESESIFIIKKRVLLKLEMKIH